MESSSRSRKKSRVDSVEPEIYFRLLDSTTNPSTWVWHKFSAAKGGDVCYIDDVSQLRVCAAPASVMSSTLLGIGSYIYCFGGDRGGHSSPDVSRYDTSRGTNGYWEIVESMNLPKIHPQVVALRQKVYVIPRWRRDYNRDMVADWAEYLDLDPSCDEGWKPLRCTYEGQQGYLFNFLDIDTFYYMVVMESDEKILFTSPDSLESFVYHVDNDHLVKVYGGFHYVGGSIHYCEDTVVAVGELFFGVDWFDIHISGSIFCISPKNSLFLVQKKVLGDDYKLDEHLCHSVFVGPGDILHVLWVSYGKVDGFYRYMLNYRAIRVPREIGVDGSGNPHLVGCRIISSKLFLLPSNECLLLHAVLLPGFNGRPTSTRT